jgi:hypothetical protein
VTHCDVYPVKIDPETMTDTLGEPRQTDDPGLNARAWGLPYFNGYTITTDLHEDGECEDHRPVLRRRVIGTQVSLGVEE